MSGIHRMQELEWVYYSFHYEVYEPIGKMKVLEVKILS